MPYGGQTAGGDGLKIVPVIMAGGSGTRLWPVSRDMMPKQFIKLFDEAESTFQATLRRVGGPLFDTPIVVTSTDFRFVCAEQLKAIGMSAQIVLEPERRDSAAAAAVGAVLAGQRSADAVCLVLAADHAILDGAAFIEDCRLAAEVARTGRIMTLGVRPTRPATSYGYIAPGRPLDVHQAFALQRFVEKPDRETASAYLAEGYLWNSGNFITSAETLLAEMDRHAPAVTRAVRESVKAAVHDLDFLRLDPGSFAKAPKISIDYAVMEKTDRAGVLETSCGWSDIGTWDQIYDIKQKSLQGNVVEGAVTLIDTKDSLISSDGILTTVLGLDDVVVVTTQDAVLVAAKSRSGEVKDLVAKLKTEGRREAGEHLRNHRPWGWYQRIDIGDRFQVKHICVKPGGLLSLQRHHHRAEHWIVVHGTAEVTIDGVVKLYHENEAAYLPIGCTHRMHNPGKIDLKLIEVQVGSYTGEDDIVRLEDVYARS
ncbi:mannose-1-phosphate guanylyltransferase/mannose-6-phosphate isomerase [Aurantimonas sp. Leaf443]|uniref:mannose-1-phosphate guanylyltransferase/mannose-6-phosphate isomerase n=1 Tax=Aurantimonas sp. Leaf443 TaxID=1736378 RepID=UPI0006F67F7C|nr:mannose-1-phosphate guanylyltransferase/mannose-6-phosphate isomerase [Aurantimonas sp. Leaf443]KQT86594.1 mannose-1-phosphate guanyltransferase [Aurantimonas sp. Leaf443]